jgi:hypothetical protein
MKYYVVKLLTNTQGQDGSSVTVYASENDARVAYHNTLTTFHNADDVLYAIVQIVNELGNCEIMEIVDHKPAPEPEPAPEPIPVEEQTEE